MMDKIKTWFNARLVWVTTKWEDMPYWEQSAIIFLAGFIVGVLVGK